MTVKFCGSLHSPKGLIKSMDGQAKRRKTKYCIKGYLKMPIV